jgi:hypothetical protein
LRRWNGRGVLLNYIIIITKEIENETIYSNGIFSTVAKKFSEGQFCKEIRKNV